MSEPTNTAAINMLPLTEFHLFKRLPPELRFTIWEIASSEPRLVMLRLRANTDPSEKDEYFNPPLESIAPVPSTLHTTHESRRCALKLYKLSFQAVDTDCPRIYFNFAVDTLGIDHSLELSGMLEYGCCSYTKYLHQIFEDPEELKRVARMTAFGSIFPRELPLQINSVYIQLRHLRLEKLTFVATNSLNWRRDSVLTDTPIPGPELKSPDVYMEALENKIFSRQPRGFIRPAVEVKYLERDYSEDGDSWDADDYEEEMDEEESEDEESDEEEG